MGDRGINKNSLFQAWTDQRIDEEGDHGTASDQWSASQLRKW